jgi:hypothetical protein
MIRRRTIAPGGNTWNQCLLPKELRQRPARQPDYDKENRTLVAVARALVDSAW